MHQLTFNIKCESTKTMASTDTQQNSEIILLIILIKLSILCALKIIKLCSKAYKKHNEVVLKKNFTKYIDVESAKTENSKPSTSKDNKQ